MPDNQVKQSFADAFNDTSKAIESVLIFALALLISGSKKVTKGLEFLENSLKNTATWAVPGRYEHEQKNHQEV